MVDQFDYAAVGLQPPRYRIDPPVGPPDVSSLVGLAAARRPDDEALADDVRRFSFRELDMAIDHAAALLRARGVGAGMRVAAAMSNRWEAVVGYFAAMRLGAVWVGLNRILPPGDKAYILGHSQTHLILADRDTAAEVEALRSELPALAHILSIDDDADWVDALAATVPVDIAYPDVDPFAPAAIMYTSGTTGVPKGCVHSQHNMVTLAAAVSAHGLMNPGARRGSVLPVTITNVMILGAVVAYWNARPFILGKTAKIAPMVEWLARERIEQCAFVPTMIYDLMKEDLDLPPGLSAGAGGAPVSQAMRDGFLARHGQQLQPSYGLTEAPTVVASPQDRPTPEGASGFALPHLRISIRDTEGHELAPGEVGEVCFAAVDEGAWAHVYAPPLGYWLDAAKTAALLEGGVVHSGDVGSLDSEGWLTIADRSSELILRGGSNVYPTEIENVLQGAASVADCAIIGQPDDRLGMRTVAVIQPADAAQSRADIEEELRALCLANLSRYKIPDDWMFVDAFPRNAMGKIVKPRLRELLAPSATPA